jgi:hypothetical protein
VFRLAAGGDRLTFAGRAGRAIDRAFPVLGGFSRVPWAVCSMLVEIDSR